MRDADIRDAARTRILAKLEMGALPSIQIRNFWSELGSGRACDGCDEPVRPTELESAMVVSGTALLRLHRECFTEWQRAVAGAHPGISGGCGLAWPAFFVARVTTHARLLRYCVSTRTAVARARAVRQRMAAGSRLR